jgi:mannosyltransferase
VFFSSMLLLEFVRPQGRLRTWVIGLALSAGVTLWLHNTGMFAAFGIWTGMTAALLLCTAGPRRTQVLAVGVAGIGALLVWSPFVPLLVQQGAAMARLSYWIQFKPANTIAAWSVISGAPIMHYPVAALVLAGFAWLWKHARLHFWHLLCVLCLPILALAAYSLAVKPVFLSRLFEWLAPLGMVLLALGICSLRTRWRLPAVAVILALSAYSVTAFYRSQTENWREMLAGLAQESRPGDLVLAFPNEIQMPVTYYMKPGSGPAVTYLPGPFPALDLPRRYTGNSGAPNIAPDDVGRVRALAQGHRRVWLVERLAKLYDPDDLVMKELGSRYRLVRQVDGIGAVIRLYELPPSP